MTANFEVWTNGPGNHTECVGRHHTIHDAQRACRNDMGRLLTILDHMGRIAGLYRDGREI